MPPPRALTRDSLRAGTLALAGNDRELAGLLRQHGAPPLWGRQPGFATLVRIILEQQVSLSAARTMYLRLRAQLGDVTPLSVRNAGEPGLRRLGLTRQKSAYCAGLARSVLDGELDLRAVARAPDPAGRAALLAIPGLGPWSVDIYYLMALRRPDVWPAGDLALADALRRVKALRELPDAAHQRALTAGWAPWRSVAARLLWHYYLSTPRSRRRNSG